VGTVGDALKRVLVGRPMGSGELQHTLLPKTIALPVFASDALSSMSYATQEVLLVLALVGSTTALSLVVPVSFAVSCLLAIVIVSYHQIVRAYPGGGGAYVVAYENLGFYPGLVVGAALLLDYVLTVAVSITAGADAIVSAARGLAPYKVALTVALIGLVTLANLRGTKESGRIFAVPTYGFVISIYVLVLTGISRCIGGCPQAESASLEPEPVSALSVFLLLKAFSAGTTALTGVEAIAEGVPVFRYPQSKNASTTLTILGFLSISMFIGLSWLADQTNVVYVEHLEGQRTVVAQVADAVFSGGVMFYVVQIMTAGILILAANTAYTGFPVLSSILANDRFMPRQFTSRGDRLVLSNGIVVLAVLAVLLVYVFDANLNRLIQLYLVGVFLSFSLAQLGTVIRWRRTREPGWRRRAAINGFGAAVTAVVLGVVVITKFLSGAWIVLSVMPLIIYLMRSINRHYRDVADQLKAAERRPVDRRPGDQHIVLLVSDVDAAAARAVGYVRSLRLADVSAVGFRREQEVAWNELAPDIPLQLLNDSSRIKQLTRFLQEKRASLEPDDFLTVVVPEVLHSAGLGEIVRRPALHRLKASLLSKEGVQVLDVPLVRETIDSARDQAHEPARNFVVVLVAGVHNATLQAIEYAETLRPTDLRAVTFGLNPQESEQIGNEWLAAGIPHPLEIEASPFRDIGRSLIAYVRQFECDGVNRVLTVVVPEFVVPQRRHQLLHGQTALIVKRHLLFERGVVVASVPYHLSG
jgi:amino acid transporter